VPIVASVVATEHLTELNPDFSSHALNPPWQSAVSPPKVCAATVPAPVCGRTAEREASISFGPIPERSTRVRRMLVTQLAGDRQIAIGFEQRFDLLSAHLHSERFVFPSPTGNREHNRLLKCKAVAERTGLNSEKFDLKTFRSTYATRMLRSGFDVRTVQHWMGHKSLETTMRYLVPESDVYDRLDQVVVPRVKKDTGPTRRSVQQEVATVNTTLRREN
jgi:hypothetical protein